MPEFGSFEVGDGATRRIGTDSQSYTVVKKTAKTMTLQLDKQERHPDWKPNFIVGGFAGHCTNNYEQRWIVEPNPNGTTIVARLTKKGWQHAGMPIGRGRHPFHDYNF
jgi:hypothetical protein